MNAHNTDADRRREINRELHEIYNAWDLATHAKRHELLVRQNELTAELYRLDEADDARAEAEAEADLEDAYARHVDRHGW